MTIFDATTFIRGNAALSVNALAVAPRLFDGAASLRGYVSLSADVESFNLSARLAGASSLLVSTNVKYSARSIIDATAALRVDPASTALLDLTSSIVAKAVVRPKPVIQPTTGLGNRALREASALVNTLLDALMAGAPLVTSRELQQKVGYIRANVFDLIIDNGLGTALLDCFDEARKAGAMLDNMDRVRNAMVGEQPRYDASNLVKVGGIAFSFVEQCQIITAMTFVSRSDVMTMILRMSAVVDEVKLETAELLDAICYQYVVSLSADLMQHLSATEQQLPRIVTYTMPSHLPSLALAQRLYADASRFDELADENSVVHPAFMPRSLNALSE